MFILPTGSLSSTTTLSTAKGDLLSPLDLQDSIVNTFYYQKPKFPIHFASKELQCIWSFYVVSLSDLFQWCL